MANQNALADAGDTGELTRFSNAMESRETSIGLFRTANTRVGHNGYSLRLDGLEPGFDGNARERAIVMHGAPYVDARIAKANGRLGRSWGARRCVKPCRDRLSTLCAVAA